MRLSRHAAKTSSSNSVSMLENVAYVLSTMMEREEPCTKGICAMFNMKDFGMSNFATDYWFQLMTLLQGQKVPVRVNLLLIVNAPDWFGTSIWKIMKPMLSADFSKRVKMIYESELSKHLADGFEQYLPNEMSSGQACTDEMVNDFCEYRKAVEAAQGHVSSSENTINTNAPRPAVSRSNSTRRFDLSALQPSMMSETNPAHGSSVPSPGRMSGIPRSVSCISLASDCIKSISSSNHNSRRNGLQRQASCQSISTSTAAAAAAAATAAATTVDSPRRKPKQQNQRNLPPQSPNKRSMLLSPSMRRQSLSAESSEASYSPRNLPPQSPDKRSMLLSPSMRRQASCHSLSVDSCEALYTPRKRLPRQRSSSMLRSSPSKQPSSRNLVLQDKLGMPSLDNSCTTIASDMTEEAFM
jgi:CRAL/TRIO domain